MPLVFLSALGIARIQQLMINSKHAKGGRKCEQKPELQGTIRGETDGSYRQDKQATKLVNISAHHCSAIEDVVSHILQNSSNLTEKHKEQGKNFPLGARHELLVELLLLIRLCHTVQKSSQKTQEFYSLVVYAKWLELFIVHLNDKQPLKRFCPKPIVSLNEDEELQSPMYQQEDTDDEDEERMAISLDPLIRKC
jgi:hypothetical protein